MAFDQRVNAYAGQGFVTAIQKGVRFMSTAIHQLGKYRCRSRPQRTVPLLVVFAVNEHGGAIAARGAAPHQIADLDVRHFVSMCAGMYKNKSTA
jgi:hypothetical protein